MVEIPDASPRAASAPFSRAALAGSSSGAVQRDAGLEAGLGQAQGKFCAGNKSLGSRAGSGGLVQSGIPFPP